MAWEAGDGPGHTQVHGLGGRRGPQGGMGLQERNVPEGEPLVPMFPRPGAAASGGGASGPQGGGGTALAGWAGACAQLVGVMGVFAVVGVQVLAKAECSRPVTLAGLLLAGSSAGCGDKASQGPEAPGQHSHPRSLEAHSHGDVAGMGESQGGHGRAASWSLLPQLAPLPSPSLPPASTLQLVR